MLISYLVAEDVVEVAMLSADLMSEFDYCWIKVKAGEAKVIFLNSFNFSRHAWHPHSFSFTYSAYSELQFYGYSRT